MKLPFLPTTLRHRFCGIALLASALGPIASCEKSAPEPNPSTSTAAPSSAPAAEKPATPPPAETPPSTTAAATPAEPKSLPAPSDVGAAPADAKKTPSGLAIKVLKPGT